MRRHAILVLAMVGLGCRDRTHNIAPGAENRGHAESVEPTVDTLQQARFERASRLGRSCRPEDWNDLVLMAVNRYKWGDNLASREPRAAEDVQCRALHTLIRVGNVLFGSAELGKPRSLVYMRRAAMALSRPDVVSALDDAISGRIPLPPRGCPKPDDFASIVEFAPIQALRPAIEAHTSEEVRDVLLSTLDRDRKYNPTPRAAQLERWAAELTPEGFARVIEALGPGYTWNDGAPPPTPAEQKEIEQHALDLIERLVSLVFFDEPRLDCKLRIVDGVARGRLGELVVARLGHPDPEMRIALLQVLARVPVAGSRARVVELEATDPDSRVRGFAGDTKQWIDRGGMTKDAVKRRQEHIEAERARLGMDAAPTQEER